jgi:hypothetical protein
MPESLIAGPGAMEAVVAAVCEHRIDARQRDHGHTPAAIGRARDRAFPSPQDFLYGFSRIFSNAGFRVVQLNQFQGEWFGKWLLIRRALRPN